jgi:hypothetical protein
VRFRAPKILQLWKQLIKSTVKGKYKEVPLLNSELSYLSRMKLPERLGVFPVIFLKALQNCHNSENQFKTNFRKRLVSLINTFALHIFFQNILISVSQYNQ